ncbi:hypothetical protein D1614_19010 [Maribellus luteus]|uniref:Uncharacterized protein n=1 Tax=Maribellus luteus TaxID=2305463 RepID=A0A399ST36_9BACT|nr:hypothetical protein [Maribellus luteus]RIJ46498.1 hypothetical protein D1614_19010 [Maribellus luteus]
MFEFLVWLFAVVKIENKVVLVVKIGSSSLNKNGEVIRGKANAVYLSFKRSWLLFVEFVGVYKILRKRLFEILSVCCIFGVIWSLL